MGFMASYKRVEKLCNEMFEENNGVTQYINEMENTPRGNIYVETWNDDLKKLKHYRWIRNKISHEPDCTEQNMCEPKDELWLEDFYDRIMERNDPLTLYNREMYQKSLPRYENEGSDTPFRTPLKEYDAGQSKNVGCFVMTVIAFIIVFLIIASQT